MCTSTDKRQRLTFDRPAEILHARARCDKDQHLLTAFLRDEVDELVEFVGRLTNHVLIAQGRRRLDGVYY